MSTGLLHKAMRILTAATMLAAVATVLSCNKSTTDPEPQQGPAIEFNAADNWTKAVIPSGTEGVAALQQDERGFKVWSWFQGTTSGPMFGAEGTKVAYNGSAWDYNPKRYWMNGTYDFAAVYPSTVSGTYAPETTGTAPVLKVTNFDVTNQDDLLVAFKTGVNGANPPSKVALNFKHALANIQIRLSLKKEDFYEVQTYENGDVIYDANGEPILILDENNNPKQKGWVNVTKVEFRNISVVGTLSTAVPTITFDNWSVGEPTGKKEFSMLSAPVEITYIQTDCLADGGMLAIPQQVAALKEGELFNGEVYLELSIDFPTIINEPIKRNVTIPLQSGVTQISKWNPGMRYIYNGVVDQNFAIDFFVTTINGWTNDPLGGFIVD